MRWSIRMAKMLLCLAWFQAASAQPLKILTIGDSLTEEYRFEGLFSGPKVDETVIPIANTRNWVEIVADRRRDVVSFGNFDPNPVAYSDMRDGGYAHNYGVPGFTTTSWIGVIEWEELPQRTLGEIAYRVLARRTCEKLAENLRDESIGVVVVFLGGNDLKSDYAGIFRNEVPPALLQNSVANLSKIVSFVRRNNTTVPIVICTFPDIGATPEVAGRYTDPVLRVRARQRIAGTNAAVISLAGSLGAQVARVDRVTDRVMDETPLYLNGTVFHYPPEDLNPPDRLFCHDSFHPSTVGQALIANQILDAVNRATVSSIPLMANREIIGEVLGLNPDQPYLVWAGSSGGMTDDPDGDGVPNLVEFLLGRTPNLAEGASFLTSDGGLSFTPMVGPARFAELTVVESSNLVDDWTEVPSSRLTVEPDGTWRISPNGADRNFYRLSARPKP